MSNCWRSKLFDGRVSFLSSLCFCVLIYMQCLHSVRSYICLTCILFLTFFFLQSTRTLFYWSSLVKFFDADHSKSHLLHYWPSINSNHYHSSKQKTFTQQQKFYDTLQSFIHGIPNRSRMVGSCHNHA